MHLRIDPDWKETFYGVNYKQLLSTKDKYNSSISIGATRHMVLVTDSALFKLFIIAFCLPPLTLMDLLLYLQLICLPKDNNPSTPDDFIMIVCKCVSLS
jgi:hypothetical protein